MSDQILVARYDAQHPSDLARCDHCHRESTFDPAEGDPDERCIKCDCGGQIHFKYVEADPCVGCGKLGHWGYWAGSPKGACSRRCALQAEYAKTLREGTP